MHTTVIIIDVKHSLSLHLNKRLPNTSWSQDDQNNVSNLEFGKCKCRESNPDLLNQNVWRWIWIYFKVPQVILIDGQIWILVNKHVLKLLILIPVLITHFYWVFLICLVLHYVLYKSHFHNYHVKEAL